MRRKTELPELLAPAGSFECLVAAVAAGADAVYVGGRRFGARAYAQNFDIDELARAVVYCHLHGVKLYVTVNTLCDDRELAELFEYVGELVEIGVDALIVADLGVVSMIRTAYPELELHASTQMSVHNTDGACVAHSLGCVRVVPARELSRESIRSIVENSPTEIEVFLHGALCVCHSGQCLYSSLVGGRSGNRGECAQPCRLPYGDGYPLSLSDLSLAEHIPELIDLGVASLKIEGRMKSASYVYTVTGVYRRLLDERRAASSEECELLRRAFSRGGFTDGYFTARLGKEMLGIRSERDKEESRQLESELKLEPKRVPIKARVRIKVGEPIEMTVIGELGEVTVQGAVATAAESRAVSADEVRMRAAKVGASFLSLDEADVQVECDANAFLPVSELNAVRREAVLKYEHIGTKCGTRVAKMPQIPEKSYTNRLLSAQFFNSESYLGALKLAGELLDKIDIKAVPLFGSDEAIAKADAVALPPVVTDGEAPRVRERLEAVKTLGIEKVLCTNIGGVLLCRDLGFKLYADTRFNVTNRFSAATLRALGFEAILLSAELTAPKARDVGGGMVTYGRIPLMLTERCFIGDSFGCDRCGKSALVDRVGERFPMLREWEHRNLILNSAVTYMGDKADELDCFAIKHRHMLFTTESAEEIVTALKAYLDGDALPSELGAHRRAGRRDMRPESDKADATVKATQKPHTGTRPQIVRGQKDARSDSRRSFDVKNNAKNKKATVKPPHKKKK